MSNPNDNNINDSEFSDDEFETMNLPEGEKSGQIDETANIEEFPEAAAGQTTPTDDAAAGDAPADEDGATVQLPDSESVDATMETVAGEEFPDMDAENTEKTAELPGDAPKPAKPDLQTITDTALNEAEESPADDIGATVVDPDLAGDGGLHEDFDAQTVEVNEEGEPMSAEATQFDDDPQPGGGTLLDKPDTMQTINTRDLSPAEQEEFQRTIVDDEMASAASIADGIVPDSHTDLRDSGTIATGAETEGRENSETQLVIQKRHLIEPKPGDLNITAAADYELLEMLGEGGMGVVYAANQTSIDRQVAIKMLKAKYVEKKKQRDNFLSEAVVTGDLDHPNIVPIYDVGKNESNALFYSMKRVKGTPWRDVLPQKTLKENIEILLKVADAIAFAHSRGVIHRDLKPENIMLGDYGEVLVMDWGLALTMPTFAASRSIASTASMGCTPAYAAPELVRGPRGKIGPHSDVYLLGAILYQLVTGEPPHRGNNVLQCLAAATGNKITPTDQTGELVDIALKAMATEPVDRHEDTKAFQAAIREYLSHSESLLLSENAAKDLVAAGTTNEYDDFAKAVFGFREAIEMWDGNTRAKEGLQQAKLEYARCAQAKGDFEMGMSQLDSSDPAHAQLLTSLKSAKAEVDAREGRLKMARRLGVAMAAAILLIVSGAAFWINLERQEAIVQKQEAVKQKGIAEEQKVIAEKQKVIAEEQRDEADKQRTIAVEQEKIAVKNAEIAEERRKQAEVARQEAEAAKEKEEIAKDKAIEAGKKEMEAKIAAVKAKDEAVAAQKAAEKAKEAETKAKVAAVEAKVAAEKAKDAAILAQKKEAVAKVAALKAKEEETKAKDAAIVAQKKEAEERKKAVVAQMAAEVARKKEAEEREKAVIAKREQEYESYVAQIGLAAERISANNFKDAIDILEKLKATSPERIDWEWHRLSYLTAPKQVPVNAAAMLDAVAFRPDAKAFIAGGRGGTAFIWNASSPDKRVPLNHGADVAAVAYSRSGKQIATAGNDGIIRIWNADSNPPKVIHELKGHTDRVTGVVFAPDQSGDGLAIKQQLPANWLVSTSYDGTAILWNSETGKAVHTFRGHSYHVWAAAFSPQGNLMVTVGEDRRAVVWSLMQDEDQKSRSYKKLTEFSGHLVANKRDGYPVRMPIYAVAFSHDGNLVATGGEDGRVRIWNPLEVEEPNITDIIKSLADGNRDTAPAQSPSIKGQKLRLSGHTAAVHAVSFSRDDRQVLSGSDDNTMRIWDTQTGKVVKALRGHAGWVRACKFAPAGDVQQVLSGSHDGQARLWNVSRYTEKFQLAQSGSDEQQRPQSAVINHDDEVFAVAFDPKSQYIVTAGRNQKARIWNAKTGELFKLLGRENATEEQANALQEGHAFLASTVIPFEGGRKILTSALDNTARIWDARRGTELARLDDTGTTAAAAVSPDGTLIVTGSNVRYKDATDATGTKLKYRTYPVRIWRTAKALSAKGAPQPELELEGHRERVTAIAFSPDGKFIFSGDYYGKVILWRTSDGKQIGDFRGPGKTVNVVAFSADGRQILAASDDQVVHIWNRSDVKELAKKAIHPVSTLAHEGSVMSMALVPGKPLLLTATGGDDRFVRLWNLQSGKVVKTFAEIQSRRAKDSGRPLITGLSVSPDGSRAFAANSDDNVIHVIDLAAGKVVASRAGLGAIWSTAVYHTSLNEGEQPALRLATVGGDDTRVWAVNAQNGLDDIKLETTLAPHDAVTATDFSADGRFVITGGGDSSLKMWRVTDGKDIFKFPAANAAGEPFHTKGITHASFSKVADSNYLVTASNDGAVNLWKWNPKAQVATVERELSGHSAGVNCAVFSRDGKFLLTASSDSTARVWDITKPEAIATLKGHVGAVRCCAFSPDGSWVVTGGDDDAARIWSSTTGKLIKAPLTGHTGSITSVDVSPRGTRIITGSMDQTAKLWDPRMVVTDDKGVKEAREILTLGGRPDHTGGITSVSFSSDGMNGPIVTGSLDGTAILWLANDVSNKDQKVAGN